MASKREAIIAAFDARLATIQVANGYATSIGLNRYLGEAPTLGADDATQVLVVLVGAEVAQWQGKKCAIVLPLEVQVLLPVGASSYLAVEAGIADVKRAVEIDHDLGGLLEQQFGMKRGAVQPYPRESGSTVTGLTMTYDLMFWEGWGAP